MTWLLIPTLLTGSCLRCKRHLDSSGSFSSQGNTIYEARHRGPVQGRLCVCACQECAWTAPNRHCLACVFTEVLISRWKTEEWCRVKRWIVFESSWSSLELSYLEQMAHVCVGTRSCGVYWWGWAGEGIPGCWRPKRSPASVLVCFICAVLRVVVLLESISSLAKQKRVVLQSFESLKNN